MSREVYPSALARHRPPSSLQERADPTTLEALDDCKDGIQMQQAGQGEQAGLVADASRSTIFHRFCIFHFQFPAVDAGGD